VRFYFTGTEFLYDYNANLSKAVAAKRLPLTILWKELKRNSKRQNKDLRDLRAIIEKKKSSRPTGNCPTGWLFQ